MFRLIGASHDIAVDVHKGTDAVEEGVNASTCAHSPQPSYTRLSGWVLPSEPMAAQPVPLYAFQLNGFRLALHDKAFSLDKKSSSIFTMMTASWYCLSNRSYSSSFHVQPGHGMLITVAALDTVPTDRLIDLRWDVHDMTGI